MFTPVFQTDVVETLYTFQPGTGLVKVSDTPVNPIYCLSEDSAKAFVALFPFFKSVITDDFPLGKWMVSVNKLVPYVAFTDASGNSTAPMNAGVMANYFNHGYPYDVAYQSCLNDIISRFV